MKVSKKAGIALFVTTAVIMAVLIVFHRNPGPAADPGQELAKKIISCVVIAAACVAFIHWYDKFTGLPVELFQNRHLIWKLAKNDFKKRYAGSYLGAVWAMAQPVVTVAMYYVVFDKIMGNTSTPLREGVEVPFVLFLTAGLVPWFYFSEALNNGTNALLEYNYLVKKVVFKISILPIIKIIAATFIHVFFVCLLLIVAAIYGYYPTIYTIQIVYYSFCLFIFVLALSYTTCAVVVFFRDLSQIISIGLQIGMWATPILWNLDSLSGNWITILKLNPLVYIVNGYRSAIYEKEWFYDEFDRLGILIWQDFMSYTDFQNPPTDVILADRAGVFYAEVTYIATLEDASNTEGFELVAIPDLVRNSGDTIPFKEERAYAASTP